MARRRRRHVRPHRHVAESATKAIAGITSIEQILGRLGGHGSLVRRPRRDFLILAVLIAFVAAGQITGIRVEEVGRPARTLVVRPLSPIVVARRAARAAWRCSWSAGMGRRRGVRLARCHAEHAGVGFTTLLAAGVNVVPAGDHLLGLGVLVFGLWPSDAPRPWSTGTWRGRSSLVIVGGIGAVSHWVLDTSVFHQMASAPAVPPRLGGQRHHDRCRGGGGAPGRPALPLPGPARGMTVQLAGPAAPMHGPIDESGVAFEDLTARGGIREAALRHFAEEGYERATIRAIARSAGVSPGLLRHHYGSKEEFAHGVRRLRVRDPAQRERAVARGSGRRGGHPGGHEAVRALRGAVLGRWLCLGGADLRRDGGDDGAMAERCRCNVSDPPAIDRRMRAAVVTAMATGIPLLHDHVSRAIGADIFEPEGDRLVALALLDIYSHELIDAL